YVAAVTIGDKAIFAGGYTGNDDNYEGSKAIDIYDSQTGRWSTAQLSEAGSPQARLVGSKVVFYSYETLDIYDGDTGRWSTATLAAAREGISVATVGTQALFAGGYNLGLYYDNDGNVNVNTIDVYDDASGLWSTTTLSVARESIRAIAVNGRA